MRRDLMDIIYDVRNMITAANGTKDSGFGYDRPLWPEELEEIIDINLIEELCNIAELTYK